MGEKVNVKVKADFLDFVNDQIRVLFGTKRKIHKALNKEYPLPFGVFKNKIKKSYRYFVDLEILTLT